MATGATVQEEIPLSSISRRASATMEIIVNPETNTQITSTSCSPPPSDHNINLPLDHSSKLTKERGAPASYEVVIDPNAPPPSYDSVFGRMKEARKTSTGIFNYLCTIIFLLLSTIGCTVMLGMMIVLPICMMVMGGVYLHDCPQNEYIPIYLLVIGGVGVVRLLLSLSTRVRQEESDEEGSDEEEIKQSPMGILINGFILGWFIMGSIWVYQEYEPNYDPALGKYCNKTLYLFAFWLITSVYICMGIIIVSACISVACIAVLFYRDLMSDSDV